MNYLIVSIVKKNIQSLSALSYILFLLLKKL